MAATPPPSPRPMPDLSSELKELDSLRQKALSGRVGDTGASDDIVDSRDMQSIKRKWKADGGTLEAVGGDVTVRQKADVDIPGLTGTRDALVVKNTPNAASFGKRVEDENYILFWSKRLGCHLIPTEEDQQHVKFDIDNRVPFYPPKHRAPVLQSLADRGLAAEVRKLERMSDDELAKHVAKFKALVVKYETQKQFPGGKTPEVFHSDKGDEFAQSIATPGPRQRAPPRSPPDVPMPEDDEPDDDVPPLIPIGTDAESAGEEDDATAPQRRRRRGNNPGSSTDAPRVTIKKEPEMIVKEEPGEIEDLLAPIDITGLQIYERIGENVKSLRTTKRGGPRWNQVVARSTLNLDTDTLLDDRVSVKNLPKKLLYKRLGSSMKLKTTLYYTTSEEALKKHAAEVGERKRKRLIRPRPDRFRYEIGRQYGIDNKLPDNHHLTHFPADPRCDICESMKAQRYPAVAQDASVAQQVTLPNEVDHLDLIIIRTPDIHGNRWQMNAYDRGIKYRRGLPLSSKTPAECWDIYSKLRPGSRFEKNSLFPKQISKDRGKEWTGIFDEGVRKRGGSFREGLPGASETDAVSERSIKEFEIGTGAELKKAHAPKQFWSYAGRTWNFNISRDLEVREGKSAYGPLWGEESKIQLMPFGCFVSYMPPKGQPGADRDKFDDRQLHGIFLIYDRGGGIRVLDIDSFKEKQIKIVITRDYTADRLRFPFEDLVTGEERNLEDWHKSFEDYQRDPEERNTSYEDDDGNMRCSECALITYDAPIRCEHCKKGTQHPKKWKPDEWCGLGRCQGHGPRDEQAAKDNDDEEEAPMTEVVSQTRRRIRQKSAAISPRAIAPIPPATPRTPIAAEPPPITPPASPIPDINRARAETPAAGIGPVMLGTAISKEDMATTIRNAGRPLAAQRSETNRINAEHDLTKDEERLTNSLRRYFGLVTRVYPGKSRDVQQEPKAMDAIWAEVRQLVTKHAVNPNKPLTKTYIQKTYEDPRYVYTMMLVAMKNMEFRHLLRWRGRLVALGNFLRDQFGERIIEILNHAKPASLAVIRLQQLYELMLENATTLAGDVPGAYLDSDLSGPPVFAHIDPAYWPPEWTEMRRVYKETGQITWLKVEKSLYGMQRGDTDWNRTADEKMERCGFDKILDTVEDTIYLKEPVGVYKGQPPIMAVRYSDNISTTGESESNRESFIELKDCLGLADEPNFHLSEIVGTERLIFYNHKKEKCILFHQASYCKHMLEEYQREVMNGRPLRHASTPARVTGLVNEDEVPAYVPEHGNLAGKYVGKLQWLYRGTRIDIGVGTQRCASAAGRWDRFADDDLHRVMQYLAKYPDLGIVLQGCPDDIHKVLSELHLDADHANTPGTAKSTTGFLNFLSGPSTWELYDWGCSRQGSTAPSTTDAEVTACRDATMRSGLPGQALLECILRRRIRLWAKGDNQACIAAIKSGFSRKLSYMSKTQKVSASSLHEVYTGDSEPERNPENDDFCINRLDYDPSETNLADIMTKPLDKERHHMLLQMIGMRALSTILVATAAARNDGYDDAN